jgi:peroxiredoxin Q/BCP
MAKKSKSVKASKKSKSAKPVAAKTPAKGKAKTKTAVKPAKKRPAAPRSAPKASKPAKSQTKHVAAKAPAAKPKTAAPAILPSSALQAGASAPAFNLPSSTGANVSLASLAGQRVVLYFYPRADTPGCTVQACGFRDAIASYKSLGVPVFGISPDPIADVVKFARKFDLNFPLLADESHATAEAFGVWVEKSMYGKKYWGVARTTFIIGPDGNVEKVYEKVAPDGHDKEVLTHLKASV